MPRAASRAPTAARRGGRCRPRCPRGAGRPSARAASAARCRPPTGCSARANVASWAEVAFSRASNARAIAPLTSGLASRSSASLPKVSSLCLVSRSRSPSDSVSSLIGLRSSSLWGADLRLAQQARRRAPARAGVAPRAIARTAYPRRARVRGSVRRGQWNARSQAVCTTGLSASCHFPVGCRARASGVAYLEHLQGGDAGTHAPQA